MRAYQRALSLARAVFLNGVALMLPHHACADEYWPLFQITCVPDLNYFSIRSFGLANTPSEFVRSYYPNEKGASYTREELLAHEDQQLGLLETTYGIYTAERLQQHPYECLTRVGREVGGQPLKVRVDGNYVEPSTGQCRGTGVNAAHVTINGRDIGWLSADPSCPGLSITDTFIQARDEGVGPTIRRCDSIFDLSTGAPDSAPRPVQTTCQEWRPEQKSK